eukprot:3813227-Pyramimonas_sp.AAC.1
MTTTATTRSSSRRKCATLLGAAASPSARSCAPRSASEGNKGKYSPTTSTYGQDLPQAQRHGQPRVPAAGPPQQRRPA